MTRLDRHAAVAVTAPFGGALVGVTGVALLIGGRRLLDRAPAGLDRSTLGPLLIDLALSALPATLPIAVGLATALAGARLRADADLSALASVGVSPLRTLAAPFAFAFGVALAAWPVAHHVGPTALARIAPASVKSHLANLSRRVKVGHPGALGVGHEGAVYVLGPERVGWLTSRNGAGVAQLRELDVTRDAVTASLEAGLAWLGSGERASRVQFTSADVEVPVPTGYVSPWDRRPGRAWSTARLRAQARAASAPTDARTRWRRLAAERDALPALVLGYFLWAAGATWTGRRPRSPILVVTVAVALHYVAGRVAAEWIGPSFAAAAGLAAPLALTTAGAVLLARAQVRP